MRFSIFCLVFLLTPVVASCLDQPPLSPLWDQPGMVLDYGQWWVRDNGTVLLLAANGTWTQTRLMEVRLPEEILDPRRREADWVDRTDGLILRMDVFVSPDGSVAHAAWPQCSPKPIGFEDMESEICRTDVADLVWFPQPVPWLFGASAAWAAEPIAEAGPRRGGLGDYAQFFQDLRPSELAVAGPPTVVAAKLWGAENQWRLDEIRYGSTSWSACLSAPVEPNEIVLDARAPVDRAPPDQEPFATSFTLGEAIEHARNKGWLDNGRMVVDAEYYVRDPGLLGSLRWDFVIDGPNDPPSAISVHRQELMPNTTRYSLQEWPTDDPDLDWKSLPSEMVPVGEGWRFAQRLGIQPQAFLFHAMDRTSPDHYFRYVYIRPAEPTTGSAGVVSVDMVALDAVTGTMVQMLAPEAVIEPFLCKRAVGPSA